MSKKVSSTIQGLIKNKKKKKTRKKIKIAKATEDWTANAVTLYYSQFHSI